MAIPVVDGFVVTNATPIDGRLVFTSSLPLFASGSSDILPATRRYLGMEVYIVPQTCSYTLVSGEPRAGGGINQAVWVTGSVSASHALYANNAGFALSASWAPVSGTIDNAQTASYVLGSGVDGTVDSSSYSVNSDTASIVINDASDPVFIDNPTTWNTQLKFDGVREGWHFTNEYSVSASSFIGNLTGSILGTSSFAISSSYGKSSSYLTPTNDYTASYVAVDKLVAGEQAILSSGSLQFINAPTQTNRIKVGYLEPAQSELEIKSGNGSGHFSMLMGTVSYFYLAGTGKIATGEVVNPNPTHWLEVDGNIGCDSVTGSLLGTASYALNSRTASYVSGSVFGTSSFATSASYAETAETASWALNISSSGIHGIIESASYAVTASFAIDSLQGFSVKEFGAIGDNSNDDTLPIQAAIDSASLATATKRTVIFPRGTYKITAPLVLKSKVKLLGYSRLDSVINITTVDAFAAIRMGTYLLDAEMRDMSITGPGSGSTTGTGLWLGHETGSGFGGYGFTATNVNVSGFHIGINLRHYITCEFNQCNIQTNHIGARIQKSDGTIFNECRTGYNAVESSSAFLFDTASLNFYIIGGEHGNCGTWLRNTIAGNTIIIHGGNFESAYDLQFFDLQALTNLTVINPRMGRHAGNTSDNFAVFRIASGGAFVNVIGGKYDTWSTTTIPRFELATSGETVNYIGSPVLVKNIADGTEWMAGKKADVDESGSFARYIQFKNGANVTGSLYSPQITGSLYGTASWALESLNATASYLTPENDYTVNDFTASNNLLVEGDVVLSTYHGPELLPGAWVQGSTYTYEVFSSPDYTELNAAETSADIGGANTTALSGVTSNGVYRLTYDLTLNSGTAPNIRYVLSSTGRSTIAGLNIVASTGSNSVTFTPTSNDKYLEISVGSGNSTNFTMSNLSLREVDSLIHTNDGNVGIGTPSPSGSLEVVGNVIATSFTGSLFGTSSFAITASYVSGSVSGTSSFANSASYAITASYADNSNPQDLGSYLSSSYMSGSQNQFSGTASYAETANYTETSSHVKSNANGLPVTIVAESGGSTSGDISISTQGGTGNSGDISISTQGSGTNTGDITIDAADASSGTGGSVLIGAGASSGGTSGVIRLIAPDNTIKAIVNDGGFHASGSFYGTASYADSTSQQPLDSYLSSSYMSGSENQFSGTSSYALEYPKQPLNGYLSSSYMSGSANQFYGTSSYALEYPKQPLDAYLSSSYISGSKNQFYGTSSYALEYPKQPLDSYLSSSTFTTFMSGSGNQFEGTASFASNTVQQPLDSYLSSSYMSGSENQFEGTAAFASNTTQQPLDSYLSSSYISGSENQFYGTASYALEYPKQPLDAYLSSSMFTAFMSGSGNQFEGTAAFASNIPLQPQQPLDSYLSSSYMSGSGNQFAGTASYALEYPKQLLDAYLSSSTFTTFMSGSGNQFEGTAAFASNVTQQPLNSYLSSSYMSGSENQFSGTSSYALEYPKQPLDTYLSSSTFTTFMSGSGNQFEGTAAFASNTVQQPLDSYLSSSYMSGSENQFYGTSSYALIAEFALASVPFDPEAYLSASTFTAYMSGSGNQFAGTASYALEYPKQPLDSYLSSSYMSGSKNQFAGTASYASSYPKQPLDTYLSSSTFTTFMSGSGNQFEGTAAFASNVTQQPLDSYLSSSYMSGSENQFSGTSSYALNYPKQPLNSYLSSSYISGSKNQFYGTASYASSYPKQPLDAYLSSSTFTTFMSGSGNQFYGTASYASDGETSFDGDRTIKRSPYTSLNVGGSTLEEFIENFFFPFVPATVSISSGGTYYYETGSSLDFTVTSTITANDEVTFGTASVRRNGADWSSSIDVPPLSFGITDVGISSSYSYETFVETDNNGSPTVIDSNTRAASFIYPYLWGVSTTAGLSGNALYTEFTRQVQTQGDKNVSMVGNVVYIYFCYPSNYADLTSILDPNSFEVISSFEYSGSVPVTSSGLTNTWMREYKVYRTKLVSDPNGTYQFIY